MIEGASIDHASHPRDIATAVKETIEFDRSVRLAYEFYKKHPDETLIIVTADHETGGLTIGETTTHPFNWEYVNYQKMSKESLSKLFQKMRETGEIDTWEKTKKILAENTGLWDKIPVNAGEEAQLMQCYYETIVKKKQQTGNYTICKKRTARCRCHCFIEQKNRSRLDQLFTHRWIRSILRHRLPSPTIRSFER